MKLIIGLGNPGNKYEKTRHNFGFLVLDRLSEKMGGNFKKSRFQALHTALSTEEGQKFVLVKPETFMNVSGESVARVLGYYKLKPDSLLVVHDDLDLPLGRFKFSQSGSSGGHNGVASIMDLLQTKDFNRLRLGIGRPLHHGDAVDYVLGRFDKSEQSLADEMVEKGALAVLFYLKNGLDLSMNYFNKKGSLSETS